MKSVLILSDLHSGHQAGLTPPEYQSGDMATWQGKSWEWFREQVGAHKPSGGYDLCVINGDAIDGHGIRSGGREEITANLHRQCKIAKAALEGLPVHEFRFIRGTPYHGGGGDAWEDVLADMMDAPISNSLVIEAEGVVFDFRHKIGTSSIPHGRYTAVARDALWSQIKSERGTGTRTDIIVRSHAHYHVFCGDSRSLSMVTPALQGPWTEYGEQQCSGTTDYGFITFRADAGEYEWDAHLMEVQCRDALLRL